MSADDFSFHVMVGGHRPPLQKKILAVVADRKSRANFHRALRSRGFGIAFRLLRKIDSRLVFSRFEKIRRFLETSPTHGAGRVDVPRSGSIQRLLAVFVGHVLPCTKWKRGAQSLYKKTSNAL